MIGFVLNTCNYSSIRWYTCMIMYRKFLIKSFRYECMYNSMHAHLCNKKLHLIYERYERFNFVWMMNYIVYFFVVFIYFFFLRLIDMYSSYLFLKCYLFILSLNWPIIHPFCSSLFILHYLFIFMHLFMFIYDLIRKNSNFKINNNVHAIQDLNIF